MIFDEGKRILGVDPGEKRFGIAISDPSGTIANPLTVIQHVARKVDAAVIAQIAEDNRVVSIVIGQALDWDGQVGPSARRAARFAEALQTQTSIPVVLWDESGSTQVARSARIKMGVSRKHRSGHLDDLAAVVILQTYLDAQKSPASQEPPENLEGSV